MLRATVSNANVVSYFKSVVPKRIMSNGVMLFAQYTVCRGREGERNGRAGDGKGRGGNGTEWKGRGWKRREWDGRGWK